MGLDFQIIFQWWGTLFFIGAAAYPLARVLFPKWYDQGYSFAKAIGMAVVTWLVYLFGSLHILPFTTFSVILSAVILLTGGIVLYVFRSERKQHGFVNGWSWKTLAWQEGMFFAALLLWSWVKAHEPSIRGLEKFMDFGFMQSILNAKYFPPTDMWYAGYPVNYYYFGHMATAVLTKFSGLELGYTFNLMLAALFAFCFTMSFTIGKQLVRGLGVVGEVREKAKHMKEIIAGLLTAFLVSLAGNMQTLYAFTRGYTGEDVKPFWELVWRAADGGFWANLKKGMDIYWYANATRFIPNSIHEFPGYSFVVSDVHGHVLSIPFVILAIALLITMFIRWNEKTAVYSVGDWGRIVFYGFLTGVMLMTNALDGPIYFALFALLLILANSTRYQTWIEWIKRTGIVLGVVLLVFAVTALPFLRHFSSFVNGLAVNCPPAGLAGTSYGPLIFEGVEKCQRSAFWMWWLLWGFFVYCAAGLIVRCTQQSSLLQRKNIGLLGRVEHIWNTGCTQYERVLILFSFFSLALLTFPEFFYFKDIYPMHFRSNTMFKLGYQAYIMLSIVSGYSIITILTNVKVQMTNNKYQIKFKFQISNFKLKTLGKWFVSTVRRLFPFKRTFIVLLIPQLFLVSIFPYFSIRSYFGNLKHYDEIYGMSWIIREYPSDFSALMWLREEAVKDKQKATGNRNWKPPVIVEAAGDSYTDYERISAFSGLPTIVGWSVHEWLWRGTYDVVAPRIEDVRLIYESTDIAKTSEILSRYGASYIVVGKFERDRYPSLQEEKLAKLATGVKSFGDTTVYMVTSSRVQ